MIALKTKALMRCVRVARWRIQDKAKQAFLADMNKRHRANKGWKPDAIQRARMMNIVGDVLTESEILWLRGGMVGARADWRPDGKMWNRLRGVPLAGE